MKAVDRRPKTEAERSETALSCEPNRSLSSVVCRLWSCRGFTLIELMAVMTIIAILAGLIIGIAGYAQRKGAESQAKAEVKSMESAIEAFRLDNGLYPTSSTVRANASTNSWLLYRQIGQGSNTTGKIYLTFTTKQLQSGSGITYITDPYGNPYNYFCRTDALNNQTNKVTFDLWSYGPDGSSGTTAGDTVDDINNWKQ